MCWNETYNRVRVGQHLSDMFPIQNGLKKICFIAIAFQRCLNYDIKRIQLNQEGLKLNGMFQLSFMLMKFIYWAEPYTPKRKIQKLQ
jgi:hypothetical protein